MRCAAQFPVALALFLSASVSAQSLKSCNLDNLVPLLSGDDNQACWEATGVHFPPPANAPYSPADWSRACGVQACANVFDELLGLTTVECAIGRYHAIGGLVNGYRTACGLEPIDVDALVSIVDGSVSASSASNFIDAEDITLPPTPTPTPTPTTTNVVVEALTNNAPHQKAASLVLSATLAAFWGALFM